MTFDEIMPFLLAGAPLMICAWGALIWWERVRQKQKEIK